MLAKEVEDFQIYPKQSAAVLLINSSAHRARMALELDGVSAQHSRMAAMGSAIP